MASSWKVSQAPVLSDKTDTAYSLDEGLFCFVLFFSLLTYFFLLSHSIAEDNMNVQLKDITVTARDGRVSHLDQVYIRGSHVRFFIVPDMLRNAPMFRSSNLRGRGVGMARGRATVSRARAGGRGGR